MNSKKLYLIDNEPATASDIIKAAEELDDSFANDWLKSTSMAAMILRANGHSVEQANSEAET